MNYFPTSVSSETGTEGSEPIDLTRLAYSPESLSDKDCAAGLGLSQPGAAIKKSRFKGKNKIDIEFITKKSRRQSTFSKRKTGLMKKAYELAELTGAEVLLMIASDTNHVYTYGTTKMKPVFESEQGKLLIEACLNSSSSSCDSSSSSSLKPMATVTTDGCHGHNIDSTSQDFFSSIHSNGNHNNNNGNHGNNNNNSGHSNHHNNNNSNNHIGHQLVFNVDSAVCGTDSKIIFPVAIGNGNSTAAVAANQNLISSNIQLFQSSSNAVGPAQFGRADSIVMANGGQSDGGTVLLPVSRDSMASVLAAGGCVGVNN